MALTRQGTEYFDIGPLFNNKTIHQSVLYFLHPFKIWCHHICRVPGTLLHDTLEHRATSYRAPNKNLQFDICGNLPWLSLEVCIYFEIL